MMQLSPNLFSKLSEDGTVLMAFGPQFYAKQFGMAIDKKSSVSAGW